MSYIQQLTENVVTAADPVSVRIWIETLCLGLGLCSRTGEIQSAPFALALRCALQAEDPKLRPVPSATLQDALAPLSLKTLGPLAKRFASLYE